MVLTGREKATILLSILGAETSSRVLRYLPDELADLIAAGINHLPTPSTDALSEVMGEYQSFLALPPSAPPPSSLPSPPKRSYAVLMYERPQTVAFLLSILPPEEKADALHALPRERGVVEDLLNLIRPNPLKARIEEQLKKTFAGRLF